MGHSGRSRSPFLSLILGFLVLPSALSAQNPPAQPTAAPPPGEILQRVREAYAKLSSLSEEGLLEVVTSEGGAERIHRRRFELDLAAEGDFYFILGEMEPSEVRETLWRSDGKVVHHDSLTETHKSMPSLAAGLAAMLGKPERAALVVPSLLAGDRAVWPEAGAVSLQGEEPCGGRTCWVLAFPPGGGILESRHWIDRETLLVRKSVLRVGPETAARTYRVDHAVHSVDGAAVETGLALDGRNAGLETFGDLFNVRLATMLVRVIGRDKKPIPDLRPEDFQVFVSGQEVPVYAVDWSPAGSPSGTEPGKAETDTAQPEAPQAVIFVDAAIGHKTYVWIRDHLSLRPRLRELLASLPPRTRIAVVALRSRLEIWQDFTQDREAVYQAITRALYLNGKPGPLTERSTDPASLTAHFDFEAADRAIRHVPALTETVEALVPFSGVKSIFYLGANFDWHPWLYWKKKEASSIAEALRQARASVFVLDTRGSSYSRGVNNLPTLGRVGGGGIFYAGELGDLGLVAEVSSGYYILTFDVDTLPRSGHFIVKLRGKKGEVLVPPVKIDLAFQKEESR